MLYLGLHYTYSIFFLFVSFSYKEKLGLDCSSDYVMQVVSSHISLFVLVPPSAFFLSALVCLFCARVISLHQKLFVALIERPEFCIRKWRIPLLFAVMKAAIRWVCRAVTVPLGEWWCFFLNARKILKIFRSRNPTCFLRNVKKKKDRVFLCMWLVHNS